MIVYYSFGPRYVTPSNTVPRHAVLLGGAARLNTMPHRESAMIESRMAFALFFLGTAAVTAMAAYLVLKDFGIFLAVD